MRSKFATQYGFVVPEIKLTDDFAIPQQDLPDQDPRHGRRRTPGCASAKCWSSLGDGAAPDVPGEEVREPAFGMRAYVGAGDVRRGSEARGLRTPSTTCRCCSRTCSEVIRNNLPQLLSYKDMKALLDRLDPEYRKLADEICTVAHLLFRPAGGAEAAARRARLDPQPAPDPRGDRRDRAACAPDRADRRACAHAHGAADLRRPFRERRAQGAAPRQPLGPRLPPEPEARRQGRGRRVRHRSAPAREFGQEATKAIREHHGPRATASCSSRRRTRGPMCA